MFNSPRTQRVALSSIRIALWKKGLQRQMEWWQYELLSLTSQFSCLEQLSPNSIPGKRQAEAGRHVLVREIEILHR